MSAFSEKQNLLLPIDDIIDSGSTMIALYELAEEARRRGIRINIVGFGALVARNAGLERILALVDKKVPVAVLAIIENTLETR
jgi:adenine/guanine phosphoribosyltransferase-like PRPP-binding protein